MHISVVSPVYGAPTVLHELVKQIKDSVSAITDDFEIILVEDHSPDNSQDIIREICAVDKKVKGVFLSRNFGEQNAVNAGLDLASGEWVVTLDCDLQNPPSEIINLYNKAQEGYDMVFASRQSRKNKKIDLWGSQLFNKLLSFLTNTKQDESLAEYVIYHRKVITAMRSMGDYVRYYPLMNHWVGFKTCTIPVKHSERGDDAGSSYTFRKKLNLALKTAISFSTKPLHLIVYLGSIVTTIAVICAIIMAIQDLIIGIKVSGWWTLFVSLWIIAGIMIMIMGIIAVYIGQIFEEVKRRPSYIVGDKLNFE